MIAKNKKRRLLTMHKSAWLIIDQVAKMNEMTTSALVEEIVMSKISHDFEEHKAKKGKH